MRLFALILAAALALPAAAQGATPVPAPKKIHHPRPGSTPMAIAQKGNDAFAAAMVKGDAEALADLYAPDGQLFFFKGNTFKGREAIHAFMVGFLKDTKVKAMTITSDESHIMGRSMLDIAHYEMTTVDKDGKEETAKGRAMTVSCKGKDGKWRLWRDVPLPD